MPEMNSQPRIEDAEIKVTRYDGTIEIHKPINIIINETKKENKKTQT